MILNGQKIGILKKRKYASDFFFFKSSNLLQRNQNKTAYHIFMFAKLKKSHNTKC